MGGPASPRVEACVAVAGRLVAQVVDEPGEAVDRTQVRAREARCKHRRDGEVLAGGSLVDAGDGELGGVE